MHKVRSSSTITQKIQMDIMMMTMLTGYSFYYFMVFLVMGYYGSAC